MAYAWLLLRFILCTVAVGLVCTLLDAGFLLSMIAGAPVGVWHAISLVELQERKAR